MPGAVSVCGSSLCEGENSRSAAPDRPASRRALRMGRQWSARYAGTDRASDQGFRCLWDRLVHNAFSPCFCICCRTFFPPSPFSVDSPCRTRSEHLDFPARAGCVDRRADDPSLQGLSFSFHETLASALSPLECTSSKSDFSSPAPTRLVLISFKPLKAGFLPPRLGELGPCGTSLARDAVHVASIYNARAVFLWHHDILGGGFLC